MPILPQAPPADPCTTAAWTAAVGLVDISNVALLYRLRRCGDWLALRVGHVLAASVSTLSGARIVLIDEHKGEQLDRIPVVRGEIRIADRVHLQPDRIANVLADGGDVVIRAAWKNARWQQQRGEPFDLIDTLGKAAADRIDVPVLSTDIRNWTLCDIENWTPV
jgi:hypothetical protein